MIFHKNLNTIIADVNLAMKPDLCIVDGIVSMAGGGAIYGNPIKSNLLITGKDPVSVDSVCAKIFDYNPSRIGHIQKAKKIGVGTDNYILVRDDINFKQIRINDEFPFWKKVLFYFGRNLRVGARRTRAP